MTSSGPPSAADAIHPTRTSPNAPSLPGRPKPAVFIPLGALGIAAAAQIAIPMNPVPLTMQTYAVVMVGALGGSRLGFAACAAYLAAAALGAPVLADGESGLGALVGVTGGYLVAFLLAAALVGWVEERNMGRSAAVTLGAMLGGHALTLAIGTTWLGSQIGASDAVSGGLTPFIPGAVIKSVLGVASLVGIRAVLRRRKRGAMH